MPWVNSEQQLAHIRALAKANKGKKRPQHSQWMKLHFHLMHGEEQRRKVSQSLTGRPKSTSAREKQSLAMRGRYKGSANPFFGKHHTDAARETFGASIRRRFQEDPTYRQRVSQAQKHLWAEPSYRDRTLRAIITGGWKRPTSLEKLLLDIIKAHKLPLRYTGDGSCFIGGKNPDFIATEGRKVCVEVANRFHHKGDYELQRASHFAQYGWVCLIVWEEDFQRPHEVADLIKAAL